MRKLVKRSALALLVWATILSLPLVHTSLSVRGTADAALAYFLAIVLVFLGPLTKIIFEFDLSDTFTYVAVILGAGCIFWWVSLARREYDGWLLYLPVSAWALMGGYFGVLQVYIFAT